MYWEQIKLYLPSRVSCAMAVRDGALSRSGQLPPVPSAKSLLGRQRGLTWSTGQKKSKTHLKQKTLLNTAPPVGDSQPTKT